MRSTISVEKADWAECTISNSFLLYLQMREDPLNTMPEYIPEIAFFPFFTSHT